MAGRHRIKFPPESASELAQDEAYFLLMDEGGPLKLRLHDYDQLYQRPGLYEQMFYDRLKCTSPKKVAEILKRTLDSQEEPITQRRVLDLGAGNGMMGEQLKSYGVARLVGVDIIPEARDAMYRDRPAVYDDYYVSDLTDVPSEVDESLEDWHFDCLTSVAALGFGDIPPEAFLQALSYVGEGGWMAFNIKETFLDADDSSGFSRLIRHLVFSKYVETFHMEKYRHRLSMEGRPLFYYAIVARKNATIPDDFLKRCEVEG